MSSDDYDREYLLLNKAFRKARENDDIILDGLNLIPLRPDPTITSKVILHAAKEQNEWCNDTEVSALWSISSIDVPLKERSSMTDENDTQTLREFLKNQHFKESSNHPEFLFKQVEPTSYDRVLLTYKKKNTAHVKGFIRTFDRKIKDAFTQ